MGYNAFPLTQGFKLNAVNAVAIMVECSAELNSWDDLEHQAEEPARRIADRVGTLRSKRPEPNRRKSVAEAGLEPARGIPLTGF